MPVSASGKFITIRTANTDFWSTQALTIYAPSIISVKLGKTMTGERYGPTDGISIVDEKNQHFMRYQDFGVAEKDYNEFISVLSKIGD